MSLVYRSIWQDDRADLCDGVFADLCAWTAEKHGFDVAVPDDNQTATTTRPGRNSTVVEVEIERARRYESPFAAVRASVVEAERNGARWQTTLRSWRDDAEGIGHVWTDVSVVGDHIDLRTLSPAAPRLVRRMLDSANDPRSGNLPLWLDARTFRGADNGEELAEIVSDLDRRLPLVVFTRDDTRFEIFGPGTGYTYDDLVERVVQRVAGIANVAVLDGGAALAFTRALGDSFGVWDGAFRVYLHGVDPAIDDDAWRHRFVRADRWMGRLDTGASMVARMLSTTTPTRRPPASFGEAKALLATARSRSHERTVHRIRRCRDRASRTRSDRAS